MNKNTEPSQIQSAELANVIAFGMQNSLYFELALTAQKEDEGAAADYLWRKAYDVGLASGNQWLAECAQEVGAAPIFVPLAKPLLEIVRADEEPIKHDTLLSTPLMRRTAALIAAAPDERLTRALIANILDTPVETVHRTVALLRGKGLIDDIRPSKILSFFAPKPELLEHLHDNSELELLYKFFKLRGALGLKTERQVTSFLVSLGQLVAEGLDLSEEMRE